MNNFSEPEPKPFILINIPDEEPKREGMTTLESFKHITGQLELELEVCSEYLFVGSGNYDFNPISGKDKPDVWYTFYQINGVFCIPGTSIKGCIRAILEAISNSCVSQTSSKTKGFINEIHYRCNNKDKLCPACRIFGTTGLRGRVYFSDAFLKDNHKPKIVKISELWPPKKPKKMVRRFYENKKFVEFSTKSPQKNHRFVEAFPRETKFKLKLCFENLKEEELGLIFYALGWKPNDKDKDSFLIAFTPKIGGAKPRCFGAVNFKPLNLKFWEMKSLRFLLEPTIKSGKSLESFIYQCLEACKNSGLLHKNSWNDFTNKMRTKNENCPRGVY